MAVVACLLAIPAAASPPPGGSVLPHRHIMVVHNIDLVAAFGYPSGETLTLQVKRGGIPIARVVAPVYPAEVRFGLVVNRGPVGPVRPGDCFELVTPDVRPGDLVEATASDGRSRALIDDILIDDVAEDGDGFDSEDVLVTGTARYANGAEIPHDALDSGAWRIGDARGAGPLVATNNGQFTARYEAPNYNAAGVTSKDAVINQATHEMGYGRVEPPAPFPPEIQLVDGVGEANGPFGVPGEPGSCPGRASEPNDITVADDPVVNVDSGALNLSGPAENATSAVSVTLTDGDGPPVTAPFVHLEQDTAGKAWDAQFTRAQLLSLDDGTLTATASFDGTAQATRPVLKDTLAPAPPTATPDAGSYVGEQFVSLNAEPGATIRFTIGAAEPITGETFGEAIRVSSDATIRAIAIDAAGNESEDVEFEYDIQPPAQGAGGGGAAGGAAGGETGRGGAPADQGAGTVDANTLRVTGLRTRSRIRLAGARRRGVSASFVAPPGASVARVELFRLGGAARRARRVGAVTVVLDRAGRHSVRLASRRMRRGLRPGQYRIVVRVGTSRNELGRRAATRVRIVR